MSFMQTPVDLEHTVSDEQFTHLQQLTHLARSSKSKNRPPVEYIDTTVKLNNEEVQTVNTERRERK